MRRYIEKILSKLVSSLSIDELRFVDKKLHLAMPQYANKQYQEHQHYFYWENQVDYWQALPSPIRPSSGDIFIYKNFLSHSRRHLGPIKNVLLLGSTPELRDLLATLPGARIYIADFSYRMSMAMLRFTEAADPLKETWVKANWLELPFPENFFDVILGDLVLQQFPSELEQEFLGKIGALLGGGGSLISRFHFLDDEARGGDISSVIKKTLNTPLGGNEKFILLKLRILWLFADPSARILHREISAAEFKKFVEAENIKDPIVKRALRASLADKASYRSWSPPLEAELEKILEVNFNIENKGVAKDYEEARIYPIFSLTRKPKLELPTEDFLPGA